MLLARPLVLMYRRNHGDPRPQYQRVSSMEEDSGVVNNTEEVVHNDSHFQDEEEDEEPEKPLDVGEVRHNW